jgi:hypothetical protein
VLACSYSLNLEDIMMVNILGMVLKYCKYGVSGDLLEKNPRREGEREKADGWRGWERDLSVDLYDAT